MFQRSFFTFCALLVVGLPAQAAELNGFDDLKQLIEEKNIDTLDKLVRALPVEFRSQYVLMTKTQSSHQATTSRPRVIMMGNDCKVLMAFSGSFRDPNYESLEMVEFHEPTAEFVFHEIKFDRKRRTEPVFSEANPSGCLDCHGASPRPNWEPADAWPGAIGMATKPSELDLNKLSAFMYRKDARYRGLLAARNRKEVASSKETFAAKMARDLNRLNAKRVARRLYESPDYGMFKYAIVAALSDSPRFPHMVPVSPAKDRTPEGYRDLLTDVSCDIRDMRRTIIKDVAPTTNVSSFGWSSSPTKFAGRRNSQFAGVRIMANLRYLFETRDIDISDFSTSFESTNLLTSSDGQQARMIVEELYALDESLSRHSPLPNDFLKVDGDRVSMNAFLDQIEQLNDTTLAAHNVKLWSVEVPNDIFKIGECPKDKAARLKREAELAKQAQEEKQASRNARPQRNAPRRAVPATPAVPVRSDGTRINQPPKRFQQRQASLKPEQPLHLSGPKRRHVRRRWQLQLHQLGQQPGGGRLLEAKKTRPASADRVSRRDVSKSAGSPPDQLTASG